jgi:hypothetical protein
LFQGWEWRGTVVIADMTMRMYNTQTRVARIRFNQSPILINMRSYCFCVLSAFGMQESIHISDHVARVREQGFRRLVLGGFDSVRSQDLVQQLQQEPAVELVRDSFFLRCDDI